jgi:hypothetical protein
MLGLLRGRALESRIVALRARAAGLLTWEEALNAHGPSLVLIECPSPFSGGGAVACILASALLDGTGDADGSLVGALVERPAPWLKRAALDRDKAHWPAPHLPASRLESADLALIAHMVASDRVDLRPDDYLKRVDAMAGEWSAEGFKLIAQVLEARDDLARPATVKLALRRSGQISPPVLDLAEAWMAGLNLVAE